MNQMGIHSAPVSHNFSVVANRKELTLETGLHTFEHFCSNEHPHQFDGLFYLR